MEMRFFDDTGRPELFVSAVVFVDKVFLFGLVQDELQTMQPPGGIQHRHRQSAFFSKTDTMRGNAFAV